MIGFVSEKISESGALGMSVMGGIGSLAVSLALPVIGIFMDMDSTGASTLQYMTVMPAILIVAFAFLNFRMKKN